MFHKISMQVLFALFASVVLPSCVTVSRNSVAEGRDFHSERIAQIIPGMTKDEVTKRLGKPYAFGRDLAGDDFVLYRRIATKTASGGAGLIVGGYVGSFYQEGASVKVRFDGDTIKVKDVSYEFVGYEKYKSDVAAGDVK